MQNIHQYSRSEWNNTRHKWMELNLTYKKPSVGYYIANTYAYIYYDTESFGYDAYDLFKKNEKAKEFLKDGVMKILENYKGKSFEGNWFSLDIKGINPSEVKQASEDIYNLLIQFGTKFISGK